MGVIDTPRRQPRRSRRTGSCLRHPPAGRRAADSIPPNVNRSYAMYVSVSFHKILPQHIDDYITNMNVCAEASNKEPGCIRYEVMQDVSDPGMMCLFQVFKD